MADGPEIVLPLFPLNTVVFPGMLVPLHLFEERYLRLLRERATADPIFGIIKTSHGREVADQPEIHRVGTAARLLVVNRLGDDSCDIVVMGTDRFSVESTDWSNGYLTATIRWVHDQPSATDALSSAVSIIRDAFEQFLVSIERSTGQSVARSDVGHDPVSVGYAIVASLRVDPRTLQQVLEMPSPLARLERLTSILNHERRLLHRTLAGGAALGQPGTRFHPN